MNRGDDNIKRIMERLASTSHYDEDCGPREVNEIGAWGDSPLIIVVSWNDPEVVQDLLDAGAAIDYQGDMNNTALHKAALLGHSGIVDVLLRNGAKTNLYNSDGESALNIVQRHLNDIEGGVEFKKIERLLADAKS